METLKKITNFVSKYMAVIVIAVAALALFAPNTVSFIKTSYVNTLLGIVMFGMGSAGSVSAAQHIAICLKVWTRSVEKHGAMPFRMFRFTFLPVTPILSGISAEGRAGYAITL